MMEAAVQAGIPESNVLIALEPEVAVLSCLDGENKVILFFHFLSYFNLILCKHYF
jgi:hypothetical protein